jgi:glutathione S-transferase
MPTLYDNRDSGNAYKVRLALRRIGQPYRRVEMDIDHGATRTAEFLKKNPNGKVPVLELDDGTCLAESGAILYYLLRDTELWPADRLDRARVLQWMFFEQYSHEPYVAVARHWVKHLEMTPARRAALPEKIEKGYAALAVMEGHLAGRHFFVGERMSAADIALYAYTHVAPEGGFDLGRFPAIRAWLGRVAAEPDHVAIYD